MSNGKNQKDKSHKSRYHNGRTCSVNLTQRQIRLLLLAAGTRLHYLLKSRAGNAITGEELDRRIDWWKEIISILEKCLEE